MIHPLPLPPKEPNDAAEAGTGTAGEGRYSLYRLRITVMDQHPSMLGNRQRADGMLQHLRSHARHEREVGPGLISKRSRGGSYASEICGVAGSVEPPVDDTRNVGLNHAGFDSDFYESTLDACPVARRYSDPGYALGMLGLLLLSWALLPLVLVALAVVWAWGRATGRGK